MARKYLAGNRIIGTSEERMTTVDQWGTDFTEAGSSLRFRLTNETHIASDSYCTDFSTTVVPIADAGVGGANTASDNGDWTSNAGTTEISSDRLNCTLDSGRDTAYYDLQNSNGLGSGNNANDVEWCMRFSVTWVTKNTDSYFAIGLSDNTSISNVNQDFMGMKWKYESSKTWGGCDTSGASVESAGTDDAQTLDPTTGTKYYFEIIRFRGGSSTGTTDTYRVCLFPDSTYATTTTGDYYGTPEVYLNGATTRSVCDSATGTSINDLRYIKIMCGGTNTSTIRIDDLRFFNKRDALGVTFTGGNGRSQSYKDNNNDEFQNHTSYPKITNDKFTNNMDQCSVSGGQQQRGMYMLKTIPDLKDVDFVMKFRHYNYGQSYASYRWGFQMPRDSQATGGGGRNVFHIDSGGSHNNTIYWYIVSSTGYGASDSNQYVVMKDPASQSTGAQNVDYNLARTLFVIITKEGNHWTIKNVTPPAFNNVDKRNTDVLYHHGTGTKGSWSAAGKYAPTGETFTVDLNGRDGNGKGTDNTSSGNILADQPITRMWFDFHGWGQIDDVDNDAIEYGGTPADLNYAGCSKQDRDSEFEIISFVSKQKAFTPTAKNTIYEETDTGLTFIWTGTNWTEFDKRDYSSGQQDSTTLQKI